MKHCLLLSTTLAVAVVLPVATAATAAAPVVFTVTGSAANGRPLVEGVTNLPDGTQLLLTLSRKASGYSAQDKLKVQNGRFKSNQFSDRGGPLLPGIYTLELVGPLTVVQPSASALGTDYANFSSPLLKRGKLGTTLEYRTTLAIPGQSSSVADVAARKAAEQDKALWLKKSCGEIPGIRELLTGKKMSRTESEAFIKDCLEGTVK